MSKDIRIKKGLNIKLKGKAEKTTSATPHSGIFAIKPTDFHGVTPKMAVKVGDQVACGDVVFYSKSQEEIKFVSPVSGKVVEIERGAKRRILAVKIEAQSGESKDFGKKNPSKMDREAVLSALLEGGLFPLFKQRPYDVMANPTDQPKAIFISGLDSTPLGVDYGYVLAGQTEEFQVGLNALAQLTEGKVHLSMDKESASFYGQFNGVEAHLVDGAHPAGNVGVQISHISPMNQGERAWVINPQDVAAIGHFFARGTYPAHKVVALVGSSVDKPQYFDMIRGEGLDRLLEGRTKSGELDRVINGDVFTGDLSGEADFLGAYSNEITVIPEGKAYRAFGWLPWVQNYVHSSSRTSLSWLNSGKEYELNANMNGEVRALVETGKMEKVMPMDIFPMQLLKAILEGDIEKMENLGIYEVAPEDFALIDYTSSSKIEAQQIVREGLDLMIKEVG